MKISQFETSPKNIIEFFFQDDLFEGEKLTGA
jgi:hypothetical protein